jgi:hypothetical protein
MGNEMNFLNQHLQTTSILLQKQLDLARDSLHACSVQFARKFINNFRKRKIFRILFRFKTNDSTTNLIKRNILCTLYILINPFLFCCSVSLF